MFRSSQRQYKLSYLIGEQQSEFALPLGTTIVGRSSTCGLVLDVNSVSRRHASFVLANGQCVVHDLGSRAGTFVNGKQVEHKALSDRDKLLIGDVQLTVIAEDPSGAELTEQPPAYLEEHTTRHGEALRASVIAAIDQRRLLTLFADVAHTLMGTQPVDDVLGRVVELAYACTDAERVVLLLVNDAGELTPQIVRHRAGVLLATAISKTILNRVINERVSLLAVDAQADPLLGSAASIHVLATRSFMCVPLWHEGVVIGALYVDNALKNRFSEADLELFTAFSNFAGVAIAQARLATRVQLEIRRRERLERYHSPTVVERLLRSDGDAEADAPMLAQERDVTIAFTDIVGFTSIVERLPPPEVAVLLNAFFSRMADAIFEYEGTLDKFMGDSVLAVFGAPLSLPNHALNAVKAAQKMQRLNAELNLERGEPHLSIRIAIHSGMALVGDIGSSKRRDYTVLGNTVNTAHRIEQSIARGGQIVITRETRDRLGNEIPTLPIGSRRLRGQTRDVELFEVPSEDQS